MIYVLDGHVNNNILTTSGKNKVWIEHELKKHNINSIKDVLIAMVDTQGKFVYQLYDENQNVKGDKK
ncbi:YetF domain-containing protein [Clostridium sp.]|uniref:YetF domain-containing protein n=1 Tax=Clostridium sp. TaxID=1506 RepID=UPI00345B8CF8